MIRVNDVYEKMPPLPANYRDVLKEKQEEIRNPSSYPDKWEGTPWEKLPHCPYDERIAVVTIETELKPNLTRNTFCSYGGELDASRCIEDFCGDHYWTTETIYIDLNKEGKYFTAIEITDSDYRLYAVEDALKVYGDIKEHVDFESAYEWTKRFMLLLREKIFFSRFTQGNFFVMDEIKKMVKKLDGNRPNLAVLNECIRCRYRGKKRDVYDNVY